MTPQEISAALAAGAITADRAEELLNEYESKQAAKQAEDEAEAFLTSLEGVATSEIKRVVKSKALLMNIRASLLDDKFEQRELRRKASSLKWSLKGSGGVSF